ncbi:MAG TPA: prepilin-type N-terminal cleavage/methylation domain-containing protein [Opitutaceae bacterium]|nr:prepilin-type N-terminal cleavage/methylation domain-containing protein [Opitutaceae bacterium]
MKRDRESSAACFRDAGFTLVELLVASAITVVLAGIMIAMLAQMSRTWVRSGGGLAARQQAEQALDVLARDLESAILHRDGRVWLAATIQPDQSGAGDAGGTLGAWSPPVRKPGAANPGSASSSLALEPASGRIEDCRFGMAGVWLRFVANVPDRNAQPGDTSAPRVISYQIVRRAVSAAAGSAQRYALFRAEVRPYADESPARERSAFVVGFDVFAPAYNSAAGGGNLGDAGTVRRPRRDLLLANDVIDFGVRFFRRDPSAPGGERVLFPRANGNLGFAATTDAEARPPNPDVAAGAMSYGFPTEAELLVRVLTEEGARQIEALEAGRLAGRGWWEIALAHSVVLTRSMALEATP